MTKKEENGIPGVFQTREEAMEAYHKASAAAGGTYEDGHFIKLKDGETIAIRLLPRVNAVNKAGEKGWKLAPPFIFRPMHYMELKGRVFTLLCNHVGMHKLRMSPEMFPDKDDRCPACELINELQQSSRATEEQKKLAAKMVPRTYWFARAIDGRNNQIGLLSLAFSWGQKLTDKLSEFYNDYPYFAEDPEHGFWISVKRTGVGFDTSYTFEPKQIPKQGKAGSFELAVEPVPQNIMMELEGLEDLEVKYRFRSYSENMARMKGEGQKTKEAPASKPIDPEDDPTEEKLDDKNDLEQFL